MLPLNLLLAATALMIGMDSYQILSAFREFHGTYQFLDELVKSEFSTVIMAYFTLHALLKSPENRLAKQIFLLFLLLDSVFDVMNAVETNGKTSAQMVELTQQMSNPMVYFHFQLPIFVACGILMMAGITFQMKKPFFQAYPPVAGWQSFLLRFYSIVYYVEAVLLFLLGTGTFNTKG